LDDGNADQRNPVVLGYRNEEISEDEKIGAVEQRRQEGKYNHQAAFGRGVLQLSDSSVESGLYLTHGSPAVKPWRYLPAKMLLRSNRRLKNRLALCSDASIKQLRSSFVGHTQNRRASPGGPPDAVCWSICQPDERTAGLGFSLHGTLTPANCPTAAMVESGHSLILMATAINVFVFVFVFHRVADFSCRVYQESHQINRRYCLSRFFSSRYVVYSEPVALRIPRQA
jgi:hypothetical protein